MGVGNVAPLVFRSIDTDAHGELCVTFRRDSYACSFPDGAERFNRMEGAGGSEYLAWLRERLAELPAGCVHAWDGDRIVGQLELRLREDGTGYANLFYLIPEVRGTGRGRELHDYVVSVFRRLGVSLVRLSVSPTNTQAIAYYGKCGWRDTGPREGHPQVHLLELSISPSTE